MEILTIQNDTPKALRITSSQGLAAPTARVIEPGTSENFPTRPSGHPSDFANIAMTSNTRQFVLAWWTADGARAVAQTSDGSPARLGSVVEVRGDICLVQIKAAAIEVAFAIAPGHPAKLEIPVPAQWSLHDVIERFRDVVGDDDLLTRGQFVWSERFSYEVQKRWSDLVQSDDVAAAALGEARTPRGLIEAIFGYDAAAFEHRRAVAHSALSSIGQSTSRDQLLHMLSSDGNANDIYDRATSRFRAGGSLDPAASSEPDRAEYADLFDNPHRLTFATLRSLYVRCAVECYGWAEALNAHVDSRTMGGGLRGAKVAGELKVLPMAFSYHVKRYRPRPDSAPTLPKGAGDLLVYDRNLGGSTGDAKRDGPIHDLMTNLDRGILVAAYCESGVFLDQAGDANNPLEHWLLVLGYEPTAYGWKFAFWDPDARTSRRTGEVPGLRPKRDGGGAVTGFGLLHFVAASAVRVHAEPPEAGLPELYEGTGRFSTEALNGGILARGRFGYHTDAVADDDISWAHDRTGEYLPQQQHRYQVGQLRPFPTGGA